MIGKTNAVAGGGMATCEVTLGSSNSTVTMSYIDSTGAMGSFAGGNRPITVKVPLYSTVRVYTLGYDAPSVYPADNAINVYRISDETRQFYHFLTVKGDCSISY